MVIVINVGPGHAFTSLQTAINYIDTTYGGVPLSEEVLLLAHNGITLESIIVPASIQPTALYPLLINAVDFDRPVISSYLSSSYYTELAGFRVNGDVEVKQTNLVERNKIQGWLRCEGDSTPSFLVLINNEIVNNNAQSAAIFLKNIDGDVIVYNNNIYTFSENMIKYCIELDNVNADVKQNIFSGDGLTRLVYYKDSSPVFTRNIYWTQGDAKVAIVSNAGTTTEYTDIQSWQLTEGQDPTALFTDPKYRSTASPFDLDIYTDSPAIAEGDFLPEVVNDIQETPRPAYHTTIGAYEYAEIFTDDGKTRLLELLGGLSQSYISRVAVGDKGTVAGNEHQPATPSHTIENEIYFDTIPVRYMDGQTGVLEVHIRPVPGYVDPDPNKINKFSEIALSDDEGLIFITRTFRSIPYDPLSSVDTVVDFRITIEQ